MSTPATTVVVTLDQPITRGDTSIDALTLRKPQAPELRGLKLTALLEMEVTALYLLIPRIAMPPITQAEAEALDPADLTTCAVEIAGFFTPAKLRVASLT